jgi:hypothetical protein
MYRSDRIVRALTTGLLSLAVAAALAGCGSDSSTNPQSTGAAAYITRVQTIDGSVVATYHDGTPPSGGSGAAVTTHLTGAVLVGGSSQLALSSASPFSTVIVSIDGVPGYYELDGVTAAARRTTGVPVNAQAGGTSNATIIMTVGQSPPDSTFTVHVAAGQSAETVGPPSSVGVSLTEVGTGDVQVSISWDQPSDVDLHVVDPSQNEIYYGNDTSPTGGTLDFDSNAGCSIDNKDNENITWPTGHAPHGTYTVRVDYFLSCGVTQSNYVVTIQVKGQQPRTYTGSFTGEGDEGGEGSGTTIATFTY